VVLFSEYGGTIADVYCTCVVDIILDMESDGDSDETWSGEALGFEECLFCPHVSDTIEKNIQHMTLEHSFFIPDVEYLVDLEGFISYLGEYSSNQEAL